MDPGTSLLAGGRRRAEPSRLRPQDWAEGCCMAVFPQVICPVPGGNSETQWPRASLRSNELLSSVNPVAGAAVAFLLVFSPLHPTCWGSGVTSVQDNAPLGAMQGHDVGFMLWIRCAQGVQCVPTNRADRCGPEQGPEKRCFWGKFTPDLSFFHKGADLYSSWLFSHSGASTASGQ
jgi:hypothetical protein